VVVDPVERCPPTSARAEADARPASARLARPGDLFHLVDEQHHLVQLGDQGERLP
jgi:hypothetical protein